MRRPLALALPLVLAVCASPAPAPGAPPALRRILAMLDQDATPAELIDQVRLLAVRALGARTATALT